MAAGGGASRIGRSAEVREGEVGAGTLKHQAGPEAMHTVLELSIGV